MGIYQDAINGLIYSSLTQGAELYPKDIAKFNKDLRLNKFDSHTIFMGQNGMGKTMAAFIVKSFMGKIDIARDVIYPQTPVGELVHRITTESNVNFLLDELAHLFPYKRSNEMSQVALFSAIEVARANRNAFLGCCRDILRINNNYRNGKAQLCVWLLDNNGDSSFGAVLLGSPVFEMEDKFFISGVTATYDYMQMLRQIERLPSFIGFIEFPNVDKYITKSQLQEYEDLKRQGIEHLGEKNKRMLAFKQSKMERREINEQVRDSGYGVLLDRSRNGVYPYEGK
jgi:hypothetical protein